MKTYIFIIYSLDIPKEYGIEKYATLLIKMEKETVVGIEHLNEKVFERLKKQKTTSTLQFWKRTRSNKLG